MTTFGRSMTAFERRRRHVGLTVCAIGALYGGFRLVSGHAAGGLLYLGLGSGIALLIVLAGTAQGQLLAARPSSVDRHRLARNTVMSFAAGVSFVVCAVGVALAGSYFWVIPAGLAAIHVSLSVVGVYELRRGRR